MIGQRITDFLQYLRFEKRYAQHTRTAYETDLFQFQQYIKAQFDIDAVADISHFHIRSWLATFKDEGLAARSINRKLSGLNSFYKYLLRLGVVEKNPVKQLHALRLPDRLPMYLKEREMQNLLEEITFEEGFKGATDRLICEMLYRLGIRRSELINIKENDIEWSLKQLRVLGKGNKERLVPLSSEMLNTFRAYIQEKKSLPVDDTHHLLVLETGRPLYESYVYRVVKHYLSQVTTLSKRSPHILRHTFATHLLNNGANIQAIKELLGHSSLAATQVYTHNNIDKLKEIHKLNHPRG
ncbi:MAG TPA: tyrosine-type recombinase/integrase [Flavipsychrobacter sp.]